MAKYKHLSPQTKKTPSLPISITSYHPLPISRQKKTRSSPPPASKALVHRNTRSLQRLGRQLLILVADQVRGGRELVAGHLLLSWGNARSQWRNPAEVGWFFTGKHGDFTTGTGSHETCWFRFFLCPENWRPSTCTNFGISTVPVLMTPCWFHGRIMPGPVHQVAHIEDADLGVGHTWKMGRISRGPQCHRSTSSL